jgi:probable rRNA maturation factor
MILIEIPESLPISLDPTLIEQAAIAGLLAGSAPASADLTIVLTNDAQLHQLNLQFLEIDAPTDVLSFPSGDIDPDTDQPYLGDILISYERARAQALTHSLQDELRLLVVHGVLHLLGHDHADPTEKATMWQLQREALSYLGWDGVMPD